MASVRSLEPRDAGPILDIYNYYVENSACTFDTKPLTLAQREPWFSQFGQHPYRCLVAERAGQVAGYACSTRFKERPAYSSSVEVSIYTSPQAAGSGLGTALYAELFDYLHEQPVHRAYAGITLPNPASVALHEKFEFIQVGMFNQVGYKFDEYWDVAWFEKDMH